VGLLSEPARRELNALRAFVAEHEIKATGDDIRRARDALIALPDHSPLKPVTHLPGFFTVSGCPNLMFSQSDQQPTLPQIDVSTPTHAPELSGREVRRPVLQRYPRAYPQDRPMPDLTLCREFEISDPTVLGRMSGVWMQKRASH